MAGQRTSSLRVVFAISVVLLLLFLIGYPAYLSLYQVPDSGARVKDGALPLVGVMDRGTAVLECINAGNREEEVHIILRQRGKVLEEQFQSLSPALMLATSLNPLGAASDSLAIRMGRPDDSASGAESALACWLLTYNSATGVILSTVPLAQEQEVCAGEEIQEESEAASDWSGKFVSSKIVPFNSNPLETQPDSFNNIIILKPESSEPISVRMKGYQDSGAEIFAQNLSFASTEEQKVSIAQLLSSAAPSITRGYITLTAIEGSLDQLSVSLERQANEVPMSSSGPVVIRAKEVESACSPECGEKVCGDDGCGGSCGECAGGEQCNAEGQCESTSCEPDPNFCNGLCGSQTDNCGNPTDCGECPCEPDPNFCNGMCGSQTDNCGNPTDCGECPCEPDPNFCNGMCGSQTDNCGNPTDCGECPCEPDPNFCNGMCGSQTDNCGNPTDCGECPCEPDPNFCNGLCGSQTDNCGNPTDCGECPCEPDPNFCNGLCGSQTDNCGNPIYCGECPCEPNCDNKCWGADDGCGGNCWYSWCGWDQVCIDGLTCCTTDCYNRNCGDDGCGGSCGECNWDEQCSGEGLCEPKPCEPDPNFCDGLCGSQMDNCGNWVDCGDCPCEPDPNFCDGLCGSQTDHCGNPTDCGECPDTCGNAVIETSESCDDGNAESGDGCSGRCGIEYNYSCAGEPSVCSSSWPECSIDPPARCAKEGGADAYAFDNGRCYLHYSCPLSYHLAESACNTLGGYLATISSDQEAGAVARLNLFGWIGLNDRRSEGEFDWVTGEALSYIYWCDGQPDNSTWYNEAGEDGIENQLCNGPWNDQPAENPGASITGFTCEFENLTCAPECSGRSCGDDNCGGSCGECTGGEQCNIEGQCESTCEPDPNFCNGLCGSQTDNCGNPTDCGECPCEPDPNFCNGLCGSQTDNCGNPTDCGECPCEPACEGRTCGDNNCGGSCGNCPDGQQCNSEGQCETSCQPDCAGKECGDDGCGGSCGDCSDDQQCSSEGQCETSCQSDCAGKECGDDGCGGSCGDCPDGKRCADNGQCEPDCSDLEAQLKALMADIEPLEAQLDELFERYTTLMDQIHGQLQSLKADLHNLSVQYVALVTAYQMAIADYNQNCVHPPFQWTLQQCQAKLQQVKAMEPQLKQYLDQLAQLQAQLNQLLNGAGIPQLQDQMRSVYEQLKPKYDQYDAINAEMQRRCGTQGDPITEKPEPPSGPQPCVRFGLTGTQCGNLCCVRGGVCVAPNKCDIAPTV